MSIIQLDCSNSMDCTDDKDILFDFKNYCQARADELDSNQTLYKETQHILPWLKELNNLELLTTSSQPGSTTDMPCGFHPNQKAYVAGIMKTHYWKHLTRELERSICFFTDNGDSVHIVLAADNELKCTGYYWGGRMHDSYTRDIGIPDCQFKNGKYVYLQIAAQNWGDDRVFWNHLINALQKVHVGQQYRNEMVCKKAFIINDINLSICHFLSISDLITLRWTHRKFHKALVIFWYKLLPARLRKNLQKTSLITMQRLSPFLDRPDMWEALRQHNGQLTGLGLLLFLLNEHMNYDTFKYSANFVWIYNNPCAYELYETKMTREEYEENTRPELLNLLLLGVTHPPLSPRHTLETQPTQSDSNDPLFLPNKANITSQTMLNKPKIHSIVIRGNRLSKTQVIHDPPIKNDFHVCYWKHMTGLSNGGWHRDSGFFHLQNIIVFPTIRRKIQWLKSEFGSALIMCGIDSRRDKDIHKLIKENSHFDVIGNSFDGNILKMGNINGFYERIATMQHASYDEIDETQQLWEAGQESVMLCKADFHVIRSKKWLFPQLKRKIGYWAQHVMKAPEHQYKGQERESMKRDIQEMLNEYIENTPAVSCMPPEQRIGAPLPKRIRETKVSLINPSFSHLT